MEKKLVRLKNEAVVGGVAAGLAAYVGVDKVLIRILWVMSLLLPLPPSFGWTLIIYVIMWVVLPEKDNFYVGYTNPAEQRYTDEGVAGHSVNDSVQDSQNQSIKLLGVIIAVVGGYLLLDELVDWDDYSRYLWPLILIGIGAYLVIRGKEKTVSHNRTSSNQDYTDSNQGNYYNTNQDQPID